MVWITFKEAFSFKPTPNSTIDYPKGAVANVTRACAEAAIAKGKATAPETEVPATPKKVKGDGE